MNRLVRLMKVPDRTSIPGLRVMERADCQKACKLLGDYLKVFVKHDKFQSSGPGTLPGPAKFKSSGPAKLRVPHNSAVCHRQQNVKKLEK